MAGSESLGRFSQSQSSQIQSEHVSSVDRSVQVPERSRWQEMKVGCSAQSRRTRWSRWVGALQPRSCSKWGCRLFFSPQLGRAVKSMYEWSGPEPKNQEIPAFRILALARPMKRQTLPVAVAFLQGRDTSATLKVLVPRVWRSEPSWEVLGLVRKESATWRLFRELVTTYLCR